MEQQDAVYNVLCSACGQVWQPPTRSPLWWKAKNNAEKGYLDAIHVSGVECGCEEEPINPDAPYRVTGYTDLCEDFDIPFDSLVPAAKKYLELEQEGMNVVFFIDTRALALKRTSRVSKRLEELVLGF